MTQQAKLRCGIKSRCLLTVLAFFLVLAIVPNTAFAAEFYVSPTGKATGDGSINNPWDLQTALDHPSQVKPGDTIYLRSGTYTGLFTSKLKGTATAPIKVRSYPSEWAKLDGGSSGSSTPTTDSDVLNIKGSYTWYMEFEILRSGFTRQISRSGCGVNYAGIDNDGPDNKIINTVIHDTSLGIGTFSTSPNAEVYGNILYYNGWIELLGKQRSCDHGIYGQNKEGTKEIKDNIVFYNFAIGITPHGTSSSFLDNFDIEGNVMFQNGEIAPNPNSQGRNFWWSNLGGALAQKPRIVNNYMYYSANAILGVGSLFLLSPSNNGIIQGNYMMRGDMTVTSQQSSVNLDISNNHIWGKLVGFTQSTYSNNIYYSSKPTSNSVFVRPNKYDSNRSHIIIYNWQNLNTVSVGISSLGWNNGDTYELRNAQNYFNDIVRGTYDGSGSINVPMTGRTIVQPIGIATPTSTFPEFGVFVLIKTSGMTQPPTPPPVGNDTVPAVLSNGRPTGVLPAGTTQATISLSTNEAATCKYSTTPNAAYSSMLFTFSTTGGTSHSNTVTGLSDGNAYTYYVRCQDSLGNSNTVDFIITFSVGTPAPPPDTIPPSVTITNPTTGATVSGTVTIIATALDDTVVAGVQFQLDGAELGTEVTSQPYSVSWDTASTANGQHTLTAIARDASGNTAKSSASIVVNNVKPEPGRPPSFTFPIMQPGESYKIAIENPEISLRLLSIGVKNPASNVQITVSKLERPNVPQPSGKVFQYAQITHNNLDQQNIRSASISFRVSKTWLSQNRLAIDSVSLQRYQQTEWQKLETRIVKETESDVVYETSSPGLSVYAITARPAEEPRPEPGERIPAQLVLYAILTLIALILIAIFVRAMHRR